jgi:hypothetical protein
VRILFDNLARATSTTITSDNETPGYPAINLSSIFLNEQYISIFPDDVITLDLGEDKELNCVFIAELNAALFDIEIKNNANVTQYSDTDVENARKVLPIYFDTITARYIVITADASLGLAPFIDTAIDTGAYLKMKELGTGVYYSMPVTQGEGALLSSYGVARTTQTRFFESATGQVISTKLPMLRVREYTFRQIEFSRLEEIFALVEDAGLHTTLFIDTYEDGDENEPALFSQITDIRNPVRQNALYAFTLSIKEAR